MSLGVFGDVVLCLNIAKIVSPRDFLRAQNFDFLKISKIVFSNLANRIETRHAIARTRFCGFVLAVFFGTVRIASGLGQSLSQTWGKVCPRPGTNSVPESERSLAQIGDKLCPRFGTKFAPDLGQILSQNWRPGGGTGGWENTVEIR